MNRILHMLAGPGWGLETATAFSAGLKLAPVILLAALALVLAPAPTWIAPIPGAQTVLAHGELELQGTNPPPDTLVERAPVRAVLRFSEPLVGRVSSVRVENDAGEIVSQGDLDVSTADPRVGEVDLVNDLSPGTYTVVWKSVSQIDGHLLQGRYVFHVGRKTAASPGEAPQSSSLPDAGWYTVAVRGLRWVGTLLWVGAAFWPALTLPLGAAGGVTTDDAALRRIYGLMRIGLGLAWLGAVSDLSLQAGVLTGWDVERLGSAGLWSPLLAGSRGAAAGLLDLVTLPILALLTSGLGFSVARRFVPLFTGVLVLGVRAASGHAAAVAELRSISVFLIGCTCWLRPIGSGERPLSPGL